MAALVKYNVNQVYVVGGDGTHRGANAISKEAARHGSQMHPLLYPHAVCEFGSVESYP